MGEPDQDFARRRKAAEVWHIDCLVGLQKIREVYKTERIAEDLWKTSHKMRAIYRCDGGDPSVLVNRSLPAQPRLLVISQSSAVDLLAATVHLHLRFDVPWPVDAHEVSECAWKVYFFKVIGDDQR